MKAGLAADQVAILDAIAARLIPSDEDGPGAREAEVVRYVLRALEDEYSVHQPAYASGLAAVDEHAKSRFGNGFVGLTLEQQDALLVNLEQGQATGFLPSASAFFELLRQHALEGMFGDPSWGGNAGFVGWQLLGYPGPRAVWTEEDQQLETVRT